MRNPRGVTLLELLTASAISVVVLLAFGHIDFTRFTLAQRTQAENATSPQAGLALDYLLKMLKQTDQVNFPNPSDPSHVQLRIPTGTNFDDPANYTWKEYKHDPASGAIRYYNVSCAGVCSGYGNIPGVNSLTCQQNANAMTVTTTATPETGATHTFTSEVAMQMSATGSAGGLSSSSVCPPPPPCFAIPLAPACGDGACNGTETTSSCSLDCYCSNGTCDPGETCSNCPLDCGPCSSSSSSGGCFLAGTRIVTERGLMPIEQLSIGMRVWSRTETGALALAPITETFQRQVEGHLRLTLMDGRVIRVTAEHPFWDATHQAYRKIGTFHMGDPVWQQPIVDEASAQPHRLWRALLNFFAPLMRGTQPLQPVTMLVSNQAHEEASDGSSAGGPIPIHAIVPVPGPTQVFNITVGGNHNYFAEGVLVHNKVSSSSSSGTIN